MANTYTRIYIQVVFAVEARQYLLGKEFKETIHKYITGILTEHGQKLLAILDGAQVDLIFQDSDHSTEGSMQDFMDFSPLVRRGGWFAFHDVRNGHGTQKTYEELCKRYDHVEFTEPTNLYGIGVLQL